MSAQNKHFKTLIEIQNFQADLQQIWIAKFSINNLYLATGGKMGIVKIFEVLANDYSQDFEFDNCKLTKNSLNLISETPIRTYSEHNNDIIDICWSRKVLKYYFNF